MFDWLLSPFQNFFNWVINTVAGFFTWIGSAIEWFITSIINIITFLGDIVELVFSFLGAIVNFINEAVQVAGLVIQIVLGFIGKLGAWLWHAVSLVTGFLNDFFSVAPTPIPGAPQCITAPTNHDICAFSYLFDNTVFGGSNGAIIIALILIMIDAAVVFLFVRKVMTILRMGESVTDVG